MRGSTSYTVFDVVRPRQTVVYSDEDEGILAVWNGSLTLNWYSVEGNRFYAIDCNTLQGDDRGDATLEEAVQGAHEVVAYWHGWQCPSCGDQVPSGQDHCPCESGEEVVDAG